MVQPQLFLLDANVLIHAVRDSPTWQYEIKPACDPLMNPERPIISVVTEGELYSFALQELWEPRKREQVLFLLDSFGRVSIDAPQILQAYALLDSYSRRQCGIKMGKNDLWIAATALEYSATLVTTDRDFDHLADAGILARIFIPQRQNRS